MYAAITSSALVGTVGAPVTVEAHVGNGLPGFTIVGLPDEGCREARDRVRAALLSSGLQWPNRRITVNLAGSGERKGGAAMDLAIAVGLLVAQGIVPEDAVRGTAFIAELGLDGSLRPTEGIAPRVASLREHEVIVAPSSVAEAQLARPPRLRTVSTLIELVAVLAHGEPWPDVQAPVPAIECDPVPDLSDVRGQEMARVALEVAAAGFHHILMIGPPGAGKSMLARRLPGLLPRLTDDEAFASAMARSAAGLALSASVTTSPPFRSPHHSISLVGMVGGGSSIIRPGELTIATHGVLFLDEMGEFAPSVLDALRQPLEEGVVHISRAGTSLSMPAKCLLVAASNPCPCGGGEPGRCSCAPGSIEKYLRRFSGPILDRFDLRIGLARPSTDELTGSAPGESTSIVATRVARARRIALERQGCLNSRIPAESLDEHAPVTPSAMKWLRARLDEGNLSGRGYHRLRRVARTLCDLADADDVIDSHYVESAAMMRIDVVPRRRQF